MDRQTHHSLAQPILRWVGSKRNVAGLITALWNRGFRRYLEPFCGSAAVFFSAKPSISILSDINGDLIDFYRTIVRNPEDVYGHFLSIDRSSEMYYRVREAHLHTNNVIAKAAEFLYLNRNCFNGLFRTNRFGIFNVPYSNSRVSRYPSFDEFAASCRLLSQARFAAGDFYQLLSDEVMPGDFIYLDPPYASESRLPFKNYHPNSFDFVDIDRLSTMLIEIDSRGAHFALHYDVSASIQGILERWPARRYEVRRNISGKASARRNTLEQVISNAWYVV